MSSFMGKIFLIQIFSNIMKNLFFTIDHVAYTVTLGCFFFVFTGHQSLEKRANEMD